MRRGAVRIDGAAGADTMVRLPIQATHDPGPGPALPAVRAPRPQARRAARGIEDALLTIGHDLRSPIAAAELSIRAALARGCRPDEKEPLPAWAAARLLTTAERLRSLTGLLEDLIETARPAAGRGVAANSGGLLDLRELVEEVIARMAVSVQQANCPITVSCEGEAVGRWERGAVYQIVTNLLANAVKYGDGRPVHVGIARHAGGVRLEVRDTGLGIAAGEVRIIFEKFGRSRRTAPIEGYGLGLWIVARAARRLNARLTVESAPLQGTRFVVELPDQP